MIIGAPPHGALHLGPLRASATVSLRPDPLDLGPEEIGVFVVSDHSYLRAPGLVATLDRQEQSRAARFTRPQDRARFETAHVALRVVLAACTGTGLADISLAAKACRSCGGPHGKPILRDRPEVEFSLTYSGRLALIALARVPVGVDVEQEAKRPINDVMKTIATSREIRELGACAHRADDACLRLWTRKEAYLKATGEGLGRPPTTVEVGLQGDVAVGGLQVRDLDLPTSGHVAAVAWEGSRSMTVRLGEITVDQPELATLDGCVGKARTPVYAKPLRSIPSLCRRPSPPPATGWNASLSRCNARALYKRFI